MIRPFAIVGHVINFLQTRKQFVFGKNRKDLYGEKNYCHPVTLECFSIQILVNFEFIHTFEKNFSLNIKGFKFSCFHNKQLEPLNA